MSEDTQPELGSVVEFSEDISKAGSSSGTSGAYLHWYCRQGGAEGECKNGGKYCSVTFSIAPDQFPPDFAALQPDAVVATYNFVPLDDTASARFRLKKFCEAIRCLGLGVALTRMT